ncbi:probable Mg-dependent deoxyribonuclease, TatD family [Psychrobacter arcticus 273-4]|uniref:Probable Mg-dependent deoxyribonuclease, TatD family n=1 Tax=Psychrobacter arcticus (strain DSM 17307 / VKM B-2377 / 273-4) TaxID=259536 RepID=Q4FR28_PSYA2|nr:TatD family hydrolase [Psychrobacter arcticus]AAZ19530.1 probable Mg-dependent deoxyribonuclease, TatD family [Psychrobacter arcticus 273-4]
MTATGASGIHVVRTDIFPLIDTHTHFDAPVFDEDRDEQAQFAYDKGVRHLVLVGYLYRHFARLYENQKQLKKPCQLDTKNYLKQEKFFPKVHIALGLHPFYIEQHTEAHLEEMAQMLDKQRPLAIGEIGLDTFTDAMKQPEMFAKQQRFFSAQLDMAVAHQLPVMLHIRKAHAEALALLKAHDYDAHELGGIAHSFSGGVQEAKAFAKLGFKLGVTGQITNPNAKKLRLAIQAAVDSYGIDCLVIETDCPDMMPILCQTVDSHLDTATYSSASALGQNKEHEGGDTSMHSRNVPANLLYVLYSLSELLNVPTAILAQKLWLNSCSALQTKWSYPL